MTRRYATRFWGIFTNDRLIFSNLNGMAFLFDKKMEARAQRKMLAELWPDQLFEIKPALLVEERGK